MQGKPFRLFVLFLFLFSGASGLIYQIVWTKELTLIMGVTVYAVSTVLASFMAGLALGSYLFGRWADRISRPLLVYAILEGAIGLYALLMPLLFWLILQVYILLQEPVGNYHFLVTLLRFLLCFGVLLIPTTFMGGTLPVLTKFFVERERTIGLGVGLLYAINTTGAVAGCFVSGFFLIPFLGISRTTWIAVTINLGVCILALLIARARPSEPGILPGSSPAPGPEPEEAEVFPARTAAVVFWVIGLSGLVSLGYEVLWTRVLVYFLGPSTYAFTAMLTTFLVGIALGSLFIARFTDRLRDPVTWLGLIEIALGLSALGAVLLIDHLFDIYRFLKEQVGSASWWVTMGLRFALTFIFLFLPTFCMGAAFPVAVRIYSRGLKSLGRQVGNIYSINTLFAIFGSLLTGFLLIPSLGLLRSMVALVCLNLGLGIVLFMASPARRPASKGVLVAFAGICLFGAASRFENRPIILSAHGLMSGQGRGAYEVIYCKEGVDASLAVLQGKEIKERLLNINGSTTAYTNISDLQVHRLLAHIPMAIHRDPRKVLVIGFGFGSTSYGIMQYDVERVDCVELVEDEIETAHFFESENHGVLENERFRFIAEDGRNFLLTARESYDVISMNAIHPSLAPSLYTLDCYETCRDKLNPGGMMCVWLPTTMLYTEEFQMLVRTFQAVFPHTTFWYNNPANTILLGSVEPYRIDFPRFASRLSRPGVRDDLEPVHLDDPYTFLNLLVLLPERVASYCAGTSLNTDDRPWIEFSRSQYSGFRDDMLEALFFTHKADIPAFLTGYREAQGRELRRRFDLYRRGWPFMVEAQLYSFVPVTEEKRRRIRHWYHLALWCRPEDAYLRFLIRHHGVHRLPHEWRTKQLEEQLQGGGIQLAAESLKLAGLYLDSAHCEKAFEVLERLKAGNQGESLEFLLSYGSACAGTGRLKEAVQVLKTAAGRYPEADACHALLAWLLLLREDEASRAEAIRSARRALELKKSPEYMDLLGLALYENGEVEKAKVQFEKAQEHAGLMYLTYKFHLSMIREARGDG